MDYHQYNDSIIKITRHILIGGIAFYMNQMGQGYLHNFNGPTSRHSFFDNCVGDGRPSCSGCGYIAIKRYPYLYLETGEYSQQTTIFCPSGYTNIDGLCAGFYTSCYRNPSAIDPSFIWNYVWSIFSTRIVTHYRLDYHLVYTPWSNYNVVYFYCTGGIDNLESWGIPANSHVDGLFCVRLNSTEAHDSMSNKCTPAGHTHIRSLYHLRVPPYPYAFVAYVG